MNKILIGVILALSAALVWCYAQMQEYKDGNAVLELSVQSLQKQAETDKAFIKDLGASATACIENKNKLLTEFDAISRKYRQAKTEQVRTEEVLQHEQRQELRNVLSRPLPFPDGGLQ